MPVSLALCLDAPMQSWGTRSRATIRDTATEPTKSGVVGLLAAALGVPRDDEASIAALARLRMAVRVDREGIVERDFQTAQNVPTTDGKGHRTVVSHRFYLADAVFLVVLEGDRGLLNDLYEAVLHPVWPLFLGRRAFVPSRPLVTRPPGDAESGPERPLTGAGVVDGRADQVIERHLWLELSARTRRTELAKEQGDRTRLRTVVDCPPGDPAAELRHDHPVSFAQDARRFDPRTVRTGQVQLTIKMIATEEPACS